MKTLIERTWSLIVGEVKAREEFGRFLIRE